MRFWTRRGRGQDLDFVGERRWRAAQLAGLPTLTAVIHDGTPSAGELLSWQSRDEAAAAVRERPTRGERPARWKRVRVDLGAAGNVVVTVPAFAKPGAAAALLRQAIGKLSTPEADDQAA